MYQSDRSRTGFIFNIQKFSVNDGPGIRTVVFFKGCPLSCKWCSNPESQFPGFQIFWDQKKCIGCGHCRDICPVHAVSLEDTHIHINSSLCAGCKKCIAECPGKALEGEGERKSIQEVMDVVLQDQVFYEESGGGITLSGGEFLSQPDFAENLLLASKEEGLHTCCETTGFARPEIFARLVEHIDYILFDMKHWNEQKHMEGTGVSNELPVANMKYAVQSGKKILPRIPVIPGFNDSLEDARQFAVKLKEIGIDTCQLLPFHQFGENKYHLLNKEYVYNNLPSLHKEELADYIETLQKFNIDAFF